jgi:hypothetical protein
VSVDKKVQTINTPKEQKEEEVDVLGVSMSEVDLNR